MKRRFLLASSLAAAAATAIAQPSPVPRTFVLLHGAWHGGWCWTHVARRLRAAGHNVYCPTSTGLGERAHLLSRDITLEVFVRDLVNVLNSEELENVVLVGHSFGGLPVCGAADRARDRIAKVVLLDAAILQAGQSVLGTLPAQVAEQRRVAIREAGGVSLPVPPPSYFGIAEGPDAHWLRRRLTPHPAATYDSPLNLDKPLGNGLPVTYVAFTSNPLTSIASMREMARAQPGWKYLELKVAHDAMVSAPDTLAQLLLSEAQA